MSAEDLSCLTGDWRILQRKDGHRWSLDDLATAWFAARVCAEEPPRRITDLGCGIGAVLLMLAWRFRGARCVGIEAQPMSVEMARRSVEWNGVADRCEVRLGDLRDEPPLGAESSFDLVTATPPYLVPGTASVPKRLQQAGCHIEQLGGIEDYCRAASHRLAPRGRFVVCHSHVGRTEAAMGAADLAIEERIEVIPREGKAPLFSVFSARASVDRDAAFVHEPLVVRDRRGQWTEPFRALRVQMGMPV